MVMQREPAPTIVHSWRALVPHASSLSSSIYNSHACLAAGGGASPSGCRLTRHRPVSSMHISASLSLPVERAATTLPARNSKASTGGTSASDRAC
jgi:hypothetical protein